MNKNKNIYYIFRKLLKLSELHSNWNALAAGANQLK